MSGSRLDAQVAQILGIMYNPAHAAEIGFDFFLLFFNVNSAEINIGGDIFHVYSDDMNIGVIFTGKQKENKSGRRTRGTQGMLLEEGVFLLELGRLTFYVYT